MFRRKSSRSPADLISSFWAWWSSAAPRFEAAIDTGEYGALSDEMSERVHAIDPGLQWEFSKGRNSKHLLCVTSAGNPEVRAAAHRWRMAAPPATGTWEYASARTGDPSAMTNRLEIAGHDVPLELTRFDVQIDEERQEIDLIIFHPASAGNCSLTNQREGSNAASVSTMSKTSLAESSKPGARS